ncbi:MAG: PhoH family protein [Nitrospiraceae bacterium]|nr:PhoH family protein [Nitrospiraceae bacterium]
METVTARITIDIDKELGLVTEGLQPAFKLIEEGLGVVIGFRGDQIFIRGDGVSVQKARQLIEELRLVNRQGHVLRAEDIRAAVSASAAGWQRGQGGQGGASIKELFTGNIEVPSRKRLVIPRTEAQRDYIASIRDFDMVFGIGPAGTGKTYLAMAAAVSSLLRKEVNRIVLARPAVEAGERLGFLPGDIFEKVNPYLRPLYDALFDMMEAEKAMRLIEKGVIEVAPLAFMRGRTLNDSFVILDEAQNTTSEQMKMFLTRLGFNAKTVITGDVTQIDLPYDKTSGLIEAERILKGVEGIKVIYFTEKDVVRHRLVQEILKAYERHDKRKTKA